MFWPCPCLAIVQSIANRLSGRSQDVPPQRGGAQSELPGAGNVLLFHHEEQQNCDQQGENAQTLCERNTNKHASELTIGCRRIAQRAQKELTENYSNADR